jgi:hypothetical protein
MIDFILQENCIRWLFSANSWQGPILEVHASRRAELQLGHFNHILLRALAPETSGVKTLELAMLFVGTEVPTS